MTNKMTRLIKKYFSFLIVPLLLSSAPVIAYAADVYNDFSELGNMAGRLINIALMELRTIELLSGIFTITGNSTSNPYFKPRFCYR